MKRIFTIAAWLLISLSTVQAQSGDALTGRFSIRANGEQVVFSRGNLCLAIENSSWSFAQNQYDVIGTLNIFGGALSTPIDLYGYSGSTYYNWGVSPVNANALFGGEFVDWGENAIGSSPAGYWKTMSYYEWDYLLNQRANAAALKGVAEVSGQRGLVLLPDTATTAIQATYTVTEWALAEQRGAVFLPFAGRRIRANRVDSLNTRGFYWTATATNDNYAYIVNIGNSSARLEQSERMHGQSVRLVHSIGIQRDSVYSVRVYQNCTFTPPVDTKAQACSLTVGVDGCQTVYSNTFAFRDSVILTAVPDSCGSFVAWSDGETANPRRVQMVGSMSLRAIFRVNDYAVRFVNTDGTLVATDSLPCGTIPTAPAVVPTRPATAAYSYTFAGWMPAFTAVSGDQTYTAQYDSTLNRYRVDFVNYDGTPLAFDTLEYGVTPQYTGATLPTRPATAAHEYSFAGWAPALAAVTGETTYTAQYDSTSLLYTIRFVDYDGRLIQETYLDYGETPALPSDTTGRPATAQYTYTFTGWEPAVTAVMDDATYTAQYDSTLNRYAIRFADYDQTLLATDTLDYGLLPQYTGTTPAREATAAYSYTFAGWTPQIAVVTGEETYTAVYDSTLNQYAVRFADYDGTLLTTDSLDYGVTPQYTGTTPTREATAEYSYTFSGWTPQPAAVTGDATYTAVYDSTLNKYAVRFVDYDGTLLITDTLDYGATPQYTGAALPTREATAEYSYTFSGWTPQIAAVTEAATYTAVYDSTLNQYAVRFMDYDGTLLTADSLDYGILPQYTGTTPTRTATAEYSYTFSGWMPQLANVTGDATYTAVYDSTLNQYAVRFVDYDGTVLTTDSLDYGATPQYTGTTPARDTTAQYSYTFSGWTPQPAAVTGDMTYTAVYDSTLNKYAVRFVDYDGTLLTTDSLDYGATPQYTGAALPTRDATAEYSYTFSGWTPAITAVTGNQTYTAVYDSTLNKYAVRFVDYDGTMLATDSLGYGILPQYTGTMPTREGTAEYSYTFSGWAPELVTVTGEATYTAQYDSTVNRYAVRYQDYNGTLLKTDSLNYGDMPAYSGTTPARTATAQYSYLFTGWTPAYEAVTGDQTYTAQYDSIVNRYQVDFVNYNGTLLQSDSLNYGLTPAYTGTTPTRAATAAYSYTFKGWTPAITTVTGNATYTAQYDSTAVLYAIRFLNYDSTLLYQAQLTYGTMPVYRGSTPQRPASDEFSYVFSGWFPTLTEVTGDADYIATYTGVRITYKVEFRDYDNTLLETDSVAYGVMPAYTGATPTRTATPKYSYAFSGWTPQLTAVTADQVYTAVYDSTVNTYAVTFRNYDLTVLQSTQVPYGNLPAYEGSDPQKPATQQFSYHFTGWNPTPVVVTEAAEYVAVFDSTVNRYTVTLEGDNATLIGAGTYDYGTTVAVEAQPNSGYHFVEWSDGNWHNPREITVTDDILLTALIEIDCIGLNSVPVEKIYDWLLLLNVSGLQAMGYTVTDENVTWFRAVGEVDDPEHRDDDQLVGRGFYLKVGEGFAGNGRFYAVVDVSDNISANERLCTGLIRSEVVGVGLTGLDDVNADAWAPYLYPSAVRPNHTVTVEGLLPENETQIRVIDLAGHVLQETVAPRGETRQTLTAPAVAGTYLVELRTAGQQIVLRYIVLHP